MTIAEIESYTRAIEKNGSLYKEKNFDKRIEVIDFIGFQVIDQVEALLRKADQPGSLLVLKHRVEQLQSELEQIDSALFQKLRAIVRSGECTGKAFKDLVYEYVGFPANDNEPREEAGYDSLDVLINGLFPFEAMPEQTKDLEPDMVYYQKTPARVVFELAEQVHFTKEDIFFDLGSGLGQVAILVHLLTGIRVRGIEFEPAFYDYARDCAAALNVSPVLFINTDARKADYSEGTVFFMFTPFKGDILQAVLALLRKESLLRKIKIITYGPCTAQVALESWLDIVTPGNINIYKLTVFNSR